MKLLLIALLLNISIPVFSQAGNPDTLSSKDAKELLNSLAFDRSGVLRENAQNACKCVGKIKVKKKSAEEISRDISKCIEEEVVSYSMTMQLMNTLASNKSSDTIYMSSSKKHDQHYFDIESWLRDSCSALSYIIAADNKESENSMSNNKSALKFYKKGQTALTGEDYEQAAEYFQKAVDEDDNFSFAWDNLGISLRRLNRLNEAIVAYKKSLSIDPKNVTPLQNLPVVYGMLKQYDKALESYKLLIKIYPNNPEGYYGAAQTFMNGKEDFESALSYMCKAYTLYMKTGSPYRTDAEKNINYIYSKLKTQGKEDVFNRILKENNINPGSK